jgi:hypothetical protein
MKRSASTGRIRDFEGRVVDLNKAVSRGAK